MKRAYVKFGSIMRMYSRVLCVAIHDEIILLSMQCMCQYNMRSNLHNYVLVLTSVVQDK